MKAKGSVPAIVAIEIVDDSKEEKGGKGGKYKKRTIESSVGYGYHPITPNHVPTKKFVIYKYSQHDIPSLHAAGGSVQAELQKSLGYSLGSSTTQIHSQPSVQYQIPQTLYQAPPKTTLYTTFNSQGQVGALSPQLRYPTGQGMVPVILLKVYANQLENSQGSLHTNLPQSSPYSGLNNIDLQSYLNDYVRQYLKNQQVTSHQVYQQPQVYQQVYQPQHVPQVAQFYQPTPIQGTIQIILDCMD